MSQDLTILDSDRTAISPYDAFPLRVNALSAILSKLSGGTAPTRTEPYCYWADTTTGLLKQRNGADSAWLVVGLLDPRDNILSTGTGSAYVLTLDPAIDALASIVGIPLWVNFHTANAAGTVTLSVSGSTATNIATPSARTTWLAGEIQGRALVVYDGTNFVLMTPPRIVTPTANHREPGLFCPYAGSEPAQLDLIAGGLTNNTWGVVGPTGSSYVLAEMDDIPVGATAAEIAVSFQGSSTSGGDYIFWVIARGVGSGWTLNRNRVLYRQLSGTDITAGNVYHHGYSQFTVPLDSNRRFEILFNDTGVNPTDLNLIYRGCYVPVGA